MTYIEGTIDEIQEILRETYDIIINPIEQEDCECGEECSCDEDFDVDIDEDEDIDLDDDLDDDDEDRYTYF